MGKLYCIFGKSSAGKDTIFKKLIADKKLNLKPVITYTTRPIRKNETHGSEYYFINEDILAGYQQAGQIIERRDYATINGQWSYCTIDDGQIDLTQPQSYLLIVTLEAYRSLRNYYGAEAIVPLYVTLDDGIRLERALKRERRQVKPNYEELCRRFLADSNDFSEAKLQACGIVKVYHNEKLSQCLRDVKKEILVKEE